MPDPSLVPLAHVGHWIWQLLSLAPILLIGIALIAAQLLDRRDPGKNQRDEEEAAEAELDEILDS